MYVNHVQNDSKSSGSIFLKIYRAERHLIEGKVKQILLTTIYLVNLYHIIIFLPLINTQSKFLCIYLSDF